jgi:signal transduction histidine kinase
VDWWSRWRADVARPEVPTGREELAFLTGSAVVIITVAQLTDPGSLAELLLLTPALAAFVLRGVVASLMAEVFAAAVIVPVVLVVGNEGHLEGAFFLTVMAVLYASWHLGSTTRSLAIVAASAAAPWFVAHHLIPTSGIGWTAWSSASVFTFALGLTLRRQRSLITQLEQAREELAEQAVAEERRRIARELHDLAGHTLAAVLLHVTGARHVLRRDIDEAERALRDAETVGRASLDQIRATVAALRTDERGTDPALAGSADVAALAEEYRRAGLSVTTAIQPAVADLGGPIGTALHRIARESLANVARHAPGNRVELAVDALADGVRLVVADHGSPAAPVARTIGHFGIVGMRERARALGGELDAGPTADGWRVEARLPVGTSRRGEPVSR